MNLSFYIARRYLFSKKSHNAINIISAIAASGVALATFALVCTLSVFNGFQDLVASLFTAFDPELRITVVDAKTFVPDSKEFQTLKKLSTIALFTETLEENALVRYKEEQSMVVVKGVEDNFNQLTHIESILHGEGTFKLHDSVVDYAIMGGDLVHILGTGIGFTDPLQLSAPKRGVKINLSNPAAAFNTASVYSPGCIFVVNQPKYDSQYLLTSLQFARNLFGYTKEVTAIELKLSPTANLKSVQKEIKSLLGPRYLVQDRYEQQADVFRVMEIEKLLSYVFLIFILIIASFNVVGSLSMLIIEKQNDVITLQNLGADRRLIRKIFLYEGRLISFIGALIGLFLGVVVCLIQQYFGIIPLGNGMGTNFIINAYPVSVHVADLLFVLITVLIMGFVSAWYPVRGLTKK